MSSSSLIVPYPSSYWVVYAQLLAGEHPSEIDDRATTMRLSSLLDAGVRTFVDLTETQETESYHEALEALAATRGTEITVQRMSIPDRMIPPVTTLKSILDVIDSSLRSGRPAFVHCFAGVGRTGTVVGCYLRRHGLARKGEVVTQISKLRRLMPGGRELSPHTPEQVNLVENWEDGL